MSVYAMAINDIINELNILCHMAFKEDDTVLSSPFDVDKFIKYLIFEMIKTAYDSTEDKTTLRQHRGNDSDDLRMRDSRNIAYAQHYRNQEFEELKNKHKIIIPELLSNEMNNIDNKIQGYQLNKMQYYEIDSIAKHPIFKAIVSKRICDVKKISNESFIEYMNDYDELINSLRSKLNGSDDDVLFSYLQLFTLEWKYNIELFYQCAVEAEKIVKTDIDTRGIALLCAEMIINDPVHEGFAILTDNRFIPYRNELITSIFNQNKHNQLEEKISFYLKMKVFTFTSECDGETIYNEFLNCTTKADWAEYLKTNYDIESMYVKKEWTRERIRYTRKLYRNMCKNIEKPKSK